MDKLQELIILIRSYLTYDSNGIPSVNSADPALTDISSAIKTATESTNVKLDSGAQKTQIIPTEVATALSLTESAVNTSGSTEADNMYITFITSEDFAGTINGVAIPKLGVKEYPYLPGYKYPSISYTRSAGTLYIIQAK